MSKIKVNNGLGTILLLGSVFAGWQTLLIVTALLLLFGEVDDSFKGVVVRVVTFVLGLTIVSWGWDLIVDAVGVVMSSIDKLIEIINSYLDYGDKISLDKLYSYLLNPIKLIGDIADGIVGLLLVLAKLSFVISLIGNKNMKENVITKKINEYVTKIINYVNSIDFPAK